MSSAPPEPGTDPKAGSGPADGLSGTVGLSATVRGAVDDLGSDAVPASALIEAILQRHRGDYLRGAELGERAWPVDEVRQPAQAWVRELVRVLVPDPDRGIFGRIAVAGLCLLDPQVARVAQSSGLLYAVALEISPDLVSFLSDEGLRLLRVRTPMVAWGLRALEPGVQPLLQGEAGTPCLALDDHARLAAGRVGRWALVLAGRRVRRLRCDHHPYLVGSRLDGPGLGRRGAGRLPRRSVGQRAVRVEPGDQHGPVSGRLVGGQRRRDQRAQSGRGVLRRTGAVEPDDEPSGGIRQPVPAGPPGCHPNGRGRPPRRR